ncbi:MAG: AAA family ATPase [Thermodesulfobacteriota bacterium]
MPTMDYEEYFGFKDSPFRLTADPDYYFPSEVHKEALQTLYQGIQAREWFIQITGAPGTGKTVLLKILLRQLGDKVAAARVFNPRISPPELLLVVLEDLGRNPDELLNKSREDLHRLFKQVVAENAEKGLTTVIVIDEAQNLPVESLEELRLLSNLDSEKESRLKIILAGQVDLEEKVRSPELRLLDQRITSRARLGPLSRADTNTYIHHRLTVAGGGKGQIFPLSVLDDVYRLSGGVPRLINIIVERALLAAFVDEKRAVERSHLKKAMGSFGMERSPDSRLKKSRLLGRRPLLAAAGLLVLAIVVVAGYKYFYPGKPAPPPPTPATTGQPSAGGTTMPPAQPEPTSVTPAPAPTQAAPQPAAPPAPEPGPALPKPPAYAFHLPAGEVVLSVDRDSRKAHLWQGQTGGPVLKGEFLWADPPPDGLFILGLTKDQKGFFFDYPPTPDLPAPPENLWKDLADLVTGNALAVLSRSTQSPIDPRQIERAKEVADVVKEWAAAWEAKDIESYIKYYGDTFQAFNAGQNNPKIYSRDDFFRVKKAVFARSGPIKVTISDPACLLDPRDPEMAAALFYQNYDSEVYSDEGIQVLFFRLTADAQGQQSWLIVAKLWIELKKS